LGCLCAFFEGGKTAQRPIKSAYTTVYIDKSAVYEKLTPNGA